MFRLEIRPSMMVLAGARLLTLAASTSLLLACTQDIAAPPIVPAAREPVNHELLVSEPITWGDLYDHAVFVSVLPGTVPRGASASITLVGRTRLEATVPVIDGGFDPVSINHAVVGAGIRVTVTDSGGAVTRLLNYVPEWQVPRVVRTTPSHGQLNVALESSATVVFSEPIAFESIDQTSIELRRGSSVVPARLGGLSDDARESRPQLTVELIPTTPLEAGTEFVFSFRGIWDLSRHELESSVAVAFTTRPQPPLPPPLPLDLRALTAGAAHTCALTPSGAAYCWGLNDYGQLGDGTTVSRSRPSLVRGALQFVALTAGEKHTCGLTSAGLAYCWGANHGGALGTSTHDQFCDPNDFFGEYSNCSRVPVAVGGNHRFIQLVASGHAFFGFTCGLTEPRKTYCWGVNARAALGVQVHEFDSLNPVPIDHDPSFTALTAGGDHVCGLRGGSASDAGEVFCWGSNAHSELGIAGMALPEDRACSLNGVESCSRLPLRVAGTARFTTVTAANQYTCGLLTRGELYCWGTELRALTLQPSLRFSAFAFKSLSAGSAAAHSCGIEANGGLACWGSNMSGQLGDGSTESSRNPTRAAPGLAFTEAVTGTAHTCALTVDRDLYCWGSNTSGQLGDGTATSRTSPVRIR